MGNPRVMLTKTGPDLTILKDRGSKLRGISDVGMTYEKKKMMQCKGIRKLHTQTFED